LGTDVGAALQPAFWPTDGGLRGGEMNLPG